jgi:hypothetical protein
MLAVAGVIGDSQRSQFEVWKAQRDIAYARGGRRGVVLWVVNGDGPMESRQVDLVLVDDHFAELVGDTLKEGDRVVLRARSPATQ